MSYLSRRVSPRGSVAKQLPLGDPRCLLMDLGFFVGIFFSQVALVTWWRKEAKRLLGSFRDFGGEDCRGNYLSLICDQGRVTCVGQSHGHEVSGSARGK